MKNVCSPSGLWIAVLAGVWLQISADDARAQPRLAPSIVQLAPELQAEPQSAAESKPELGIPQVVAPNCDWKPLYHCLVAPYGCKPGPCAPNCGYDKS